MLIGAATNPRIRVATLTAGTGVTITNAPGSITIGLTGGGSAVEHLTADSGGILNPTSNNFNIVSDANYNTLGGTGIFNGVGSTITLNLTKALSSPTPIGNTAINTGQFSALTAGIGLSPDTTQNLIQLGHNYNGLAIERLTNTTAGTVSGVGFDLMSDGALETSIILFSSGYTTTPALASNFFINCVAPVMRCQINAAGSFIWETGSSNNPIFQINDTTNQVVIIEPVGLSPQLAFQQNASIQWVMGSNQAVSNAFQISQGGTLGTNVIQSYTSSSSTFNVPVTITAANHATLNVIDTSAHSVTAGPVIDLYRNVTASATDVIGELTFTGNNTTPAKKTFAQQFVTIDTATAGAEDASWRLQTMQAGTLTNQIVALKTGGQYRGNNTNVAAPAGFIGEVLSTNTANPGTSLSTGVANNINSITLTAGNWMVFAIVCFQAAATTTIQAMFAGINPTISTFTTNCIDYSQINTAAGNIAVGADGWDMFTPTQFLSLAATTTYYLNAQATFAVSTLTAFGKIQAVRIG